MLLIDGVKLAGSLLVAVTLFVAPAHAVPVPSTAFCTAGATLYPAGDNSDLTTSTACEVHLGVNDSNTVTPSSVLFGMSGWVLAGKTFDPEEPAASTGDGTLLLSGVVNGGDTGTWSIGDFLGHTSVFLTLKAGNQFAAYLLDTAFTSGDWTTAQVFPDGSGAGGKGLSHMSLYYVPKVVPLPAALPLYGAGLVIMGLIGLRRRNKRS